MSDTKEKKDNLITVYKAAQSLGIKAEVLQYQIDAVVLCQEKVQIKYNQFSLFM